MVPAGALGQLSSPGSSARGTGQGLGSLPSGLLHLDCFKAWRLGSKKEHFSNIPGEQTPVASAYQAFACNVLTTDSLARASHMVKLLVHVGELHKGQIPGYVVHEGGHQTIIKHKRPLLTSHLTFSYLGGSCPWWNVLLLGIWVVRSWWTPHPC